MYPVYALSFYFFTIPYNIILPHTPGSSKLPLSFRFFVTNNVAHWVSDFYSCFAYPCMFLVSEQNDNLWHSDLQLFGRVKSSPQFKYRAERNVWGQRRKLHCCAVHVYSLGIITKFKANTMRCAGHLEGVGAMRIPYSDWPGSLRRREPGGRAWTGLTRQRITISGWRMNVRAGTHSPHVTWAHVMLRVQLGCERRF